MSFCGRHNHTTMVKPTVVQGHTFTIADRYVPKSILGRGSFGVVCTAVDKETNNTIAVKRIRPYANDEWDAKHTIREVRLLRLFKDHPNIISLYNLSLYEEKSELYMFMELMDCDLHRVIQSKQELSEAHIKCFAKQILEGIKAMHSVGVFHRDIKPGNILVSKDCQIRITDFGLARFMDERTLVGENPGNPMTEYVVTRWYRSPELLLAPNRPYSAAIDMWSVGCILAEMIRRKPLFPGKSHTHQVQMVLEVRGYSSPADLGFPLSDETKSFLNRRCIFPGQLLSSVIQRSSRDVMELIEALLQLNPEARPSAEEALKFKFLKDAQVMHDYSKVTIPKPTRGMFTFESEKMSLAELRSVVIEEVRSYNNVSARSSPADEVEALACKLSDAANTEENIARVHVIEGQIVDQDMTVERAKTAPHIVGNVAICRPHSASNSVKVLEQFEPNDDATVDRGNGRFRDLMNRKSFLRNTENDSMDCISSSEFDHMKLPHMENAEKRAHSDKTHSKIIGSFAFKSLTSLRGRSMMWGPAATTKEHVYKGGSVSSPNRNEVLTDKDSRVKKKFFVKPLNTDKDAPVKVLQDNPELMRISDAITKCLSKEKLSKVNLDSAAPRTPKKGILSVIRRTFGRRPSFNVTEEFAASYPTESDDLYESFSKPFEQQTTFTGTTTTRLHQITGIAGEKSYTRA